MSNMLEGKPRKFLIGEEFLVQCMMLIEQGTGKSIDPLQAEGVIDNFVELGMITEVIEVTESTDESVTQLVDVLSKRIVDPKGGSCQWGARNHMLEVANTLRTRLGLDPIPFFNIGG